MWLPLLYLASAALELGGLALVVAGVLADRRTRRNLLARLDALEPGDPVDRFMRTGLSGATVDADLAVRLHQQQMALYADELGTTGRRQAWGVGLFVAGTLVGLAANLVAL